MNSAATRCQAPLRFSLLARPARLSRPCANHRPQVSQHTRLVFSPDPSGPIVHRARCPPGQDPLCRGRPASPRRRRGRRRSPRTLRAVARTRQQHGGRMPTGRDIPHPGADLQVPWRLASRTGRKTRASRWYVMLPGTESHAARSRARSGNNAAPGCGFYLTVPLTTGQCPPARHAAPSVLCRRA